MVISTTHQFHVDVTLHMYLIEIRGDESRLDFFCRIAARHILQHQFDVQQMPSRTHSIFVHKTRSDVLALV